MSTGAKTVEKAMRMKDESWRRHANPWSVWTRFAAIPAFAVAVWSRDWLGWWCLAPITAVVVWLWLNTVVFAPVDEPRHWASKGIYGEKLWLHDKARVRSDHRTVLRIPIALGLIGYALLAWGLVVLDPWPTVTGASLLTLAQLWRIDRMVWLYEEIQTRA